MLFRKHKEPETVDCPVCTTGVFRTPGVKANMIADGIRCGICKGDDCFPLAEAEDLLREAQTWSVVPEWAK